MTKFEKAALALQAAEDSCTIAQEKLRALRDDTDGPNKTKMRFITEALDEAGLHLGAAVLHLQTVKR